MKFDLKTPCKECPFRNDILPYLSTERAEEIGEAILSDQTFTCHKHTHSLGYEGKAEQHCAGATIILEKEEQPNQMMRWMERIGMYDRTKLDMQAPIYDTVDNFIDAVEDFNG